MKGAARSADREQRKADLAAVLVEGPAEKILTIMFDNYPHHAPEEQQP